MCIASKFGIIINLHVAIYPGDTVNLWEERRVIHLFCFPKSISTSKEDCYSFLIWMRP
jgi:hypothetical protein